MILRTALFCSLLGVASLLGTPASAASISLCVNPTQGTVSSGQTTIIDLTISGLGNMTAPSLSAFDLDLHFDPALLSITNSVFGSPSAPYDQLNLSGLGSAYQAAQPSPGDFHLYEVSFDSPSVLDRKQQGSFILAEITMLGQQSGTSPLSLTVNDLGDSAGNPLTATTVSGTSLQVTPGAITAIPEPGSALLLVSGALLLLLARICRTGKTHALKHR